jgi:hypothetical protein
VPAQQSAPAPRPPPRSRLVVEQLSDSAWSPGEHRRLVELLCTGIERRTRVAFVDFDADLSVHADATEEAGQ